MGGAGKSAMFLTSWLPDAMKAPPVSALIHAETMVVAVYSSVARLFPYIFSHYRLPMYLNCPVGGFLPCLQWSPVPKQILKSVGLFHHVADRLWCLPRRFKIWRRSRGWDIPRIHVSPVYSCPVQGIVIPGVGSEIHFCLQYENERHGWFQKISSITISLLIACLAIEYPFFTRGFFSKEEILPAAYQHNSNLLDCFDHISPPAFYMFRLISIFSGAGNTINMATPSWSEEDLLWCLCWLLGRQRMFGWFHSLRTFCKFPPPTPAASSPFTVSFHSACIAGVGGYFAGRIVMLRLSTNRQELLQHWELCTKLLTSFTSMKYAFS